MDMSFEFIAYLADMSETFDLVIGQKSMYELEASVDFNKLAFSFLKDLCLSMQLTTLA